MQGHCQSGGVGQGNRVLCAPAYLTRSFAWKPAEIGQWLGVVGSASGFIGALLAGRRVDRCYAWGQHDARILLGIGLGPTLVAAFTDFILQDDAKLGYSLALLFAVACPVASIILLLGTGSMRRALDEAR
ncbi:hypothetical protein ACK129_16675 [Pseudomonas citrulli]|uniref:hypothetical protein n=1 Tax=Pseudomonas TaxID=286 RepID=UPI001146D600|nr:hypothetical protein [Pseudomonas azotoformans]QDH66482.1 hypothetical protein FKZ69_21515 [Pseudomonas azotoformans]